MNTRTRTRHARPDFQPSPVAAASTLLLLAMAGLAQAQQAAEPATQTVEVTGIRRGIETSVATKRNSDSIVEAVSAEDIGKLPDISIAESIARLPGLAAQRVDGRAQRISIRGLSPNYAGTLLNGREVVSSSDSRDAEFDQFPSELLSGVTIYKTPHAGLIGAGLSGTADMRTVRPLDFRGRQLVFNARGEVNSNGKLTEGASDKGGRFSVSYIDQFANNTLGVALGFAHLDSPGQEKHYKSWWWANTGNWGRPVVGAPEGGAITLNGFEATVTSSSQKRDGAMAVIEYKPSKDLRSTVDLYYSTFDQKRSMRGIMSNLGPTWNDATEPAYSNTVVSQVNGDPVLTQATIGNLKPVVRNDYNTRKDKILAAGWNTEMKLGDWTGTADLSYSRAKRREQILETYAGTLAPGSIDIDVATGNGVSRITPALNYADAATVLLSDPAGWGHDGLVKYPNVKDEIKALRLSGRRDLPGAISGMEFGANYTDRTKDVVKDEFNVNLKNGRTPVAVPSNLLLAPTSLSYAGIPGVLSYDAQGALNTMYDLSPTGQNQISTRDYDIREKLTTAYAKFSLDTQLAGVPISGNFGLQVVQTNQSSNGMAWLNGPNTVVPLHASSSYTDVLPSLNLKAEVASDTYVRFGLARTMARPRMEDMRAGFSMSLDTTTNVLSANGGNPNLKPWRANAVDLSVERYFGKRSYVAAATFYKDLRNFIYSKSVPFFIDGIDFPSDNGAPTLGTYTAPANGTGGMVAGIELSASLEGSLLTPALDGFGVVVSGTDTRSSLHEDNDVKKPLDGLSGTTTSLTLYYEKGGFSARVSNRHRSAFVTKTRGVFLDIIDSRIEPESQVDMQVSYAFDTGTLKGLQLLLQVNNLTNEPYRTRKGIDTGSSTPGATLPERYTTYGRQVMFGLNYKL